MHNRGTQAIYLYCLTRFDTELPVQGTGVDERYSLFLHSFLDTSAVLSMVSLEEFCGTSAESRLKDLSWLAPRACRHEQVVEQFMRHCAVLPIPFGTLFSSFNSLEKVLRNHHGAIMRFLDQVVGKEEWSVKVFLDRAKAIEDLFAEMVSRESGCPARLSPGRRYFHEQRIRAATDRKLRHWLKGICTGVAEGLSTYASESCQRKVLSREITGSDLDMVLNWGFLVPRSKTPEFLTRIQQANIDHSPQGLAFEPSGPWPPYSFCPSVKTGSLL
ncbi:MAG: GvpL/GvpF family gas vesicle protein [Syntrophobacteria bacterium]